MIQSSPVPLHERLDLSLFHVEEGRYSSLQIQDETYPHWLISFIRQGRVETETRGVRCPASEGDVMIHPPRLPFSERAAGPGLHQYFVFDLQVPPGLDLFRLHPVAPVVRLADPDDYTRTFDRLAVAWSEPPSPLRDLSAFTLAAHLVAAVLQSWQATGSPPRPDALRTPEDRFADVVTYMADRLDRKLTRDELARRVFLHPNSFDRAFRTAYGVPPLRMLRGLRLRRARALLESTDDTLETISAACGLGDAAALSRAFKAEYGVPPGVHRTNARQARQSVLIAPSSPSYVPGPPAL